MYVLYHNPIYFAGSMSNYMAACTMIWLSSICLCNCQASLFAFYYALLRGSSIPTFGLHALSKVDVDVSLDSTGAWSIGSTDNVTYSTMALSCAAT